MTNYERAKALFADGFSAYTPTLKGFFVKKDRYTNIPAPGRIVFFWKDSRGNVGHVGIVDTVEYRNGVYYMTTIEGNTSAGKNNTVNPDGGKVAYKKYDFLPSQVGGGNMIDGFAMPFYGAETCSAEQLLAIARSQVGYLEKATNAQLNSQTANAGKNNYTKFGAWAKECGWGYNPAAWCAMFVCWCAYTAVSCAHGYTPGWEQDGKRWKFRKQDGTYCANEWLYDGGRWYVFAGDGYMITGWFRQGVSDWYYLADDGGMCASQWVWKDDKCYYLTASGVMAKNAYIRAEMPFAPGRYIFYWVDGTGAYCPEWDTEKPALDIYELAA